MEPQNETVVVQTTERPFLTERMKLMKEAFDTGCLEDLANHLYLMAQIDLNIATAAAKVRGPKGSFQRTWVRKSLQDVLKDANGERAIATMLHAMEPDVIESLIDNTFAWRLGSSKEFQQKQLKSDSCQGIYVLGISVEGCNGRGLCSREWVLMRDMMKRYLNPILPEDVPERGTEERVAYEKQIKEAISIESHFARRGQEAHEIEGDVTDGRRKMAFDHSKAFLRMLQERAVDGSDEKEQIRQHQFPLQIRSSSSMTEGMATNCPIDGLKKSAKAYMLLLSCMKELKIPFVTTQQSVLKVWMDGMLQLGEIMVTMLSGSLIIDGGLNAAAVGTPANFDPEKAKLALEQMIDSYVRNIDRSDEILEARTEGLMVIHRHFRNDAWERKVLERIEQMEVRTKQEILRQEAIEEKVRLAEIKMKQLQEKADFLHLQLEVSEAIDKWVERERAARAAGQRPPQPPMDMAARAENAKMLTEGYERFLEERAKNQK